MILCQLIIRIMNSRSRIDFKEISERLQTLKALLFHTSNPWQVRQARRLWQAARIGASLYVWRVYFVFKCMQKLDDGRCKESRKRVWILLLISCLHGKKTDFLLQEVFARLILYNYASLIARKIPVPQEKQINFSVAILVCKQFLKGKITPAQIFGKLSKHLSPIRPGRQYKRYQNPVSAVAFQYRFS